MSGYYSAKVESCIIANEEDFKSFCNFDADLNGDNGEDYLMEGALLNGFSTSGDYIASEILKKGGTLEESINQACSEICDTYSAYLGYEVTDLKDGRFLASIIIGDN